MELNVFLPAEFQLVFIDRKVASKIIIHFRIHNAVILVWDDRGDRVQKNLVEQNEKITSLHNFQKRGQPHEIYPHFIKYVFSKNSIPLSFWNLYSVRGAPVYPTFLSNKIVSPPQSVVKRFEHRIKRYLNAS